MPKVKGPQSENLVSEERLRLAVQILREAGGGGCTKEEVRKGLGVTSIRTVDRALTLLEEQGARLEKGWTAVPGAEGPRRVKTVVLKKGPSWDETLSAEAKLAFGIVRSALKGGVAGAWRDQLDQIQDLLEGKLTERDRKAFENLKDKVVVHGARGGSPTAEGVLDHLLKVLAEPHPRSIQATYSSAASGRTEVLEVVPWCLLHDLFSSGAFLLAWNRRLGLPVLLRLNRIQSLIQGKRESLLPAERKALERCATYQIGGWIGVEEPFEVKVRVTGKHWVRAFVEQAPALPEVAVLEEKAGTCLVTFKASEFKAPARWVLQLGPDAEVLSPEEFRNHVAARAAAAADVYRRG